MLEAIACARVQGHYIGQAMTADKIDTLARDWNAGRSGQALSNTA
jgi:hypothetical protein